MLKNSNTYSGPPLITPHYRWDMPPGVQLAPRLVAVAIDRIVAAVATGAIARGRLYTVDQLRAAVDPSAELPSYAVGCAVTILGLWRLAHVTPSGVVRRPQVTGGRHGHVTAPGQIVPATGEVSIREIGSPEYPRSRWWWLSVMNLQVVNRPGFDTKPLRSILWRMRHVTTTDEFIKLNGAFAGYINGDDGWSSSTLEEMSELRLLCANAPLTEDLRRATLKELSAVLQAIDANNAEGAWKLWCEHRANVASRACGLSVGISR